jgi:hypothetical protein
MRAVGVNRCSANNRLAAAVPTARRAAAALGGTVPQTATDQRRAVKAVRSGRLTEGTALGSGNRPPHRRRTRRASGAVPVPPARRRPLAFPARTRCSTAASTPRNLTSGRRSRRLAPKSLMPEGVGSGRAGPIFIAASRSQDVMRSARRNRRGSAPRRWLKPGDVARRIRPPSARRPPAPRRGPRSARARPASGGRAPRSPPCGPSRAPGPRARGTRGSARSRADA